MKSSLPASALLITVVSLLVSMTACNSPETQPQPVSSPAQTPPSPGSATVPAGNTVNHTESANPRSPRPDRILLDKEMLGTAPGAPHLSPKGQVLVQKAADSFRAEGSRFNLLVTGYTSTVGTRYQNIILSHHRAEVVAKALTRAGVPSDRITIRGLGPENPIADNKTNEGRLRNHRVEIEFTEAGN